MQVVRQETLGGPEVLRVVDVPRPEPRPTEVLIRVKAAGVNPVDWKTRQRGVFLQPPFVLGWEISGVVAELGLGTTLFQPGDEVFGLIRFPEEAGGYGEYVTAPARQLARKPAELSHEEAAGLPLAGLTAWQALIDVAELSEGQRVLVHGAGGGVGHLAVQLAAARGAHVIGTARSVNHGFLRELGVVQPVDYTAPDWLDQVGSVDVVVDPIGGDVALALVERLRPGGILVSLRIEIPPELAEAARRAGVRATSVVVEPDRVGLLGLVDLVVAGALRPTVDQVFPLDQAGRAHTVGELGRTRGKLVLTVP
ncbi:MAG TPA: NADP-dependent oxidoreductase [Pseudonocardia sp.]|jgi:NADPH:quinone reductase-like Zn-dependent oxidoreductase|nr:NADP-dependent oxidoreductase [Pseudonocardia sp.]